MATQVAERTAPRATRRQKLAERLQSDTGLLPYLLVLPTLVVILVIAVYPILNSIWISFQENPLSPAGQAFAGLKNYIAVLSDRIFQAAMLNTFVYMVISVALEAFFGLLIALLINKTFRGRGLVRAAILVPWAFPTVVSAQMWLLMYNDQTGIITFLLQQVHLLGSGETLLGSSQGVITAMVITDVWKTTPFMALLILAGLQVISAELYEAAG